MRAKRLAPDLFDHQRFAAFVADEIGNRAADGGAERGHHGIDDGAPGIDGDVVGDDRIERNAEEWKRR